MDPENTNFILKLTESVGPIGTVLLILFFYAVASAFRFVIYKIKKKEVDDLIKRVKAEFESMEKNLNLFNEDQIAIANTLQNITQVIIFINNKMRNVISESDSLKIIRTLLSHCLLLNFIKETMDYANKFQENPSQIENLKEQMKLELKNSWLAHIDLLSSFNFPIIIAESINNKFYLEQINNGNGIIFEIIETTFKNDFSIKEKYSRVVNYHNLFVQQVMAFVEEEFKKTGR